MPSELMIDFVAGCLGGAAGVLAGHPLDTVKVRLQAQNLAAPRYSGSFSCFRAILSSEGVSGLYKGISSPLASLAFINAIIFGVHGYVVKRCDDRYSLWTHFIAGACAGSAQAIVASPMELLKLRVQLDRSGTAAVTMRQISGGAKIPLTPYSCLRTMLSNGEHRKLLRGHYATQLRDIPALGVYFASYEFLARKLSSDGTMESLTSTQLLFAGGASGMASWLFNYPIDVIKTRFQADDSARNYADVIAKAYREAGWRSFFAGFGPTILRAFPTNAATFFTVEWTYRLLIDQQKGNSNLYSINLLFMNVGVKPDDEHAISLRKHAKLSAGKTALADLKPTSTSYSEENTAPSGKRRRVPLFHPTVSKLWNAKTFLLPEAGTTLMEPLINFR